MRAADRLIVALDVPTLPAALRCARRLQGLVRTVKVGSVLFTACGPEAIRRLRTLGFRVMLDLKFFDIPSTVEGSCRVASAGIWALTVHAAGGEAMLRAAVRGAGRRARVLGVTVLTSDGSARAGVTREVVRRAQAAVRAGCDGVVASAREAALLRRRFGPRLLIVCPGIRPSTTGPDDQRRVVTPAAAIAAGASHLVVGRPITRARNPRAAARAILADITEGLAR